MKDQESKGAAQSIVNLHKYKIEKKLAEKGISVKKDLHDNVRLLMRIVHPKAR